MIGIFLHGLDTVDDVLAIRAAAITILAGGGQVMGSWTSEGTTVTKYQGLPIAVLIQEANAFLQQEDSGSYGKRYTRTIASFNNSY